MRKLRSIHQYVILKRFFGIIALIIIISTGSPQCFAKKKIPNDPDVFLFKMIGSGKLGSTIYTIGKENSRYYAMAKSIKLTGKVVYGKAFSINKHSLTRFINILNYVGYLDLKPLFAYAFDSGMSLSLYYESQGIKNSIFKHNNIYSYNEFYDENTEKIFMKNKAIKNHEEFMRIRENAFKWSFLTLYISSIFEFRDENGKISFWK